MTAVATDAFGLLEFGLFVHHLQSLRWAMGYAFSATTTSVFVDFYLFCEVLFGKFFHPLGHVQKGVCAGYFGDVEVVHKLVCEGGKIKVDGI